MKIYVKTVLVCLLLGLSTAAFGAEKAFKPSISVSEEFNDNIGDSTINKRSEYLTQVQPGAIFSYKAPLWNWDINSFLVYRHYARNSAGDEFNYDLTLNGTISVIDNFFFLDVNDAYHRISSNISLDTTQDSPLGSNLTDQNIATVSPYLLWHWGDKSTLKTGYRYIDTRYWGQGLEKRQHDAFAGLNHEMTAKLSVSADYIFSSTEVQPSSFTTNSISAGFRYSHAENSFFSAKGGYSVQRYANGTTASNPFWDVGVTQDCGFAVATLGNSVQFSEDPLTSSTKTTTYSVKLDRLLQRGAIGFSSSYSETETTQSSVQSQQKLAFGVTGKYELMSNLTGNLALTSEHFNVVTPPTVYPYHLIASGGLRYVLKDDLTLSVTYTYVTYRNALDASSAKETNRAVVEIKKVF